MTDEDLVELYTDAHDGPATFEDREGALYVALRLTTGDDRWTATDVADFADYLLTGAKPDLSAFALRIDPPGEPFVAAPDLESDG